MSKTNTKTVLTAKGRIDTDSAALMDAMKQSVQKNVANIAADTVLAQTMAQDKERERLEAEAEAQWVHGEVTAAPTVDSISDGIRSATDALAGVFVEMELRRRGDNGKLYPIAATMPGEVEDTGELELINGLRSLQTFLTGTICNRLEAMLDFNGQRVAQAQAQLRQRRSAEREGRATDKDVEVAQGWLETYEYQRELLSIAFTAAQDAHFDALGVDFETKAMREAAARARARAQRTVAPKVTSAHAERMARLHR